MKIAHLLRVRLTIPQACALGLSAASTLCLLVFLVASAFEVAWLPDWPAWGVAWVASYFAVGASAYLLARRRTPVLVQLSATALGPVGFIAYFLWLSPVLPQSHSLFQYVATAAFIGAIAPVHFWPHLVGLAFGVVRAEAAA